MEDKESKTQKQFSDDEEDDSGSDQELIDKVNAKLKSLKSTYANDSSDEDDENIEKIQNKLEDTQSQLEKSTIVSTPLDSSISLSSFKASSETSSIAGSTTNMNHSSNNNNNNFGSNISSWFNNKKKLSEVSTSVRNCNGFATENGEFICYRLLITRSELNSQLFEELDPKDQENITSATNSLISLFNEFRKNVENHETENSIEDPTEYIDWDFWSNVINNYSEMIEKDPVRLFIEISNGIPSKLRGLFWQIILKSKSFNLEDSYNSLLSETSVHEKQIKKDLNRTRFITDSSMADKLDSLFNIIKAYSLFDTEVGYTQGMAFITVPLLMNMNESEAFCLLTKLMKTYGLREFFLPEMPGLHLILYQFERLLEDLCPRLYSHLSRQGIKSSMYASQWFLTMFAYKFPLDIVIRIFDIILSEGIQACLKFAIVLMIKNEQKLLQFNFDKCLDFLKDKLFDYYLIEDEDLVMVQNQETTNPFTTTINNSFSSYRVDDLVHDAMKIKILPMTLKKYAEEHEEIFRLEKEREEEIETLRSKNAQLTREIRKLETSYALLNKEHVEVANEMIQGKVNLANLEDENDDLKQEISQLEEKIKELEDEQSNQIKELEASSAAKELSMEKLKADDLQLEDEIRKTMERNLEVMEANRFLEEQLNSLEKQSKESRKEYETVVAEHEALKKKWKIAKDLFTD